MAAPRLVPATAEGPTNPLVIPLLNDMYQFTMVYSFWRNGRHDEHSVFDMFFRKPPFHGEFTIFAGLEEVLRFVQTFRFAPDEVDYLRSIMTTAEPGFFEYLRTIDCSKLLIYAVAEGTVVFPRVPVLRVEGPLAVCQLLETTLLNLCNFASLMATNAARFRLAAGPKANLIEFGLRRAQGPDGAMSATRYALMGGFNGTSNVSAARNAGSTPMGSHAHSMVTAYNGFDDLPPHGRLVGDVDILQEAIKARRELGFIHASDSELAAFVSYATAYPDRYIALVDTYDTLASGVPNFIAVALALRKAGKTALGIRLDSGDLAYLSKESRRLMREVDNKMGSSLAACTIMASNDINEAVLLSLADQGHEIDAFGIGTHLVTCQSQPALGMVYKLVEMEGSPRMKLSNDPSKVTLPGAKEAYRLLGSEGTPLLDYVIRSGETRPVPGRRLLARHPFDEKKRAYVTPSAVIPLLRIVWKGHAASAPAVAQAASAPGVPRAMLDRTMSAQTLAGSSVAVESPSARAAGASAADAGGAAAGSAASAQDGKAEERVPGSVEADAAAVVNPAGVSLRAPFPTLPELQAYVRAQLALLREDHLRPLNPTPYKVSVSPELFHFLHDLWMKEVPIPELE